MSKFVIALVFILLFVVGSQLSQASQVVNNGGGKSISITSLTIHFNKTDAEFVVDYQLNAIPKFYVLLLGGKLIEEKMDFVFSNFDYDVVKINQDKTIINVKNVSKYDKDYYLHNKIPFNTTIPLVIIYTTDSKTPSEYHNINSTPNIFYKANP